jgi:hypothetical protein
MDGQDQINITTKNGALVNFLYRAALLGICGWVLVTVRSNNDRTIKMESDITHFNESVARIEGGLNTRVTKTELELTVIKMEKDVLKFQNEFLKITQPAALVPLQNKHTGK